MSALARPSPRVRAAGGGARLRRRELSELSWRLIRDEPLVGARNMALDHALALCLGDGEGVVRLYGWSRPTVSFGRHEAAVGVYSRANAQRREIGYVRRPTGGGAVFHDRELTYAVLVPIWVSGGPRYVYRRLNELLAGALAGLTAEVRMAEAAPSPRRAPGACFASAVPGELIAEGGKLVGSAQARIGGTLLQHGSILVRGDQTPLADLSEGRVRPGVSTGLGELVEHVSIDGAAEAVAMSLRQGLGGTWTNGAYTADELAAAGRLEADRYAEESWTWRR